MPVAEDTIDELGKEKTILKAGIKQDDISELLVSARSKLLRARSKRGLPVDTKRLAAWNGLALSAFVKAASVTKNKQDVQAAQKLRDFLVNDLWDGEKILRARDAQGKVIGCSRTDGLGKLYRETRGLSVGARNYPPGLAAIF